MKSKHMLDELEMDTTNFCPAIEATCVDLKRRIAAKYGVFEEENTAETGLNEEAVNALFWETKKGGKGPYQQTNKKVGCWHDY